MPIRIQRTTMPQEPGIRQSPAAIAPVQAVGNPAGAMARPAEQAAQLAEQIMRQDRDREVETKVRELDIRRRELDNEVVDGYLQSFGKDAVDGRGQALARIKQNSQTVQSGLKDREVRDVFAGQDAALTEASMNRLDGHYRQQSVRWQADTHQARSVVMQQDMQRAFDGPGYDAATGRLSDEAEKLRSGYRNEIDQLGALSGDDPARIEVDQRNADSVAYGGVADTLIRQERFVEALNMLGANKDRIGENDRQALIQRAKHGQEQAQGEQARATINDTSARVADVLTNHFERTDSTGVAVVDTQAALAHLRDEFTAGKMSIDVRDAAEKRIEHTAIAQQKRRDEAINQNVADAEAELTANPGMDPNDLPTKRLAVLVEHGKLSNLVAFANNGRHVNRSNALTELAQEEDGGTLQNLSAVQFRAKYSTRLDNQTFDRYEAKRASLRNEATGKQVYLRSLMDEVEGVLVEAKVLPADGKAGTEQLAWKENFLNELQSQIDKDKVTDRKQVLEMAKRMAAVKVFETAGIDEEVPLSTQSKESRETAYVNTSQGDRQIIALQAIDPRTLAAIDEDLRKSGSPVTERTRLEYYATNLEPRQKALDRLQAVPHAEWIEAIEAIKLRGGDHRNPVEIERAVNKTRLARQPKTPATSESGARMRAGMGF